MCIVRVLLFDTLSESLPIRIHLHFEDAVIGAMATVQMNSDWNLAIPMNSFV